MMRNNGYAFSILMMPLLLVQALGVRRVTPRLPEPPGDRSGIFGSGRDLRLLIIGDSAASGVGAGCQRQALSGQLVSFLGGHFRVTWKLDAQTGRTIKDVVALLEAAAPKKVDVIVASVGVNNATRGTPVKKWISCHERLIDIAAKKSNCRHILWIRAHLMVNGPPDIRPIIKPLPYLKPYLKQKAQWIRAPIVWPIGDTR